MRKPLVGTGFGCFSCILGQWDDDPVGFRFAPRTPFGLAVGTTIEGGSTGAIIGSITVDPVGNLNPSTFGPSWRLIVIRSKMPANLVPYQLTTKEWPRIGDSNQEASVIWEKIFKTKSADPGSSFQNEHFIFPKFSGPFCSAGEQLTVFYAVTSDEPSAVGYGSFINTYATFSVFGHYGKPESLRLNKDEQERSIPRGILG